MGLGNPGPKYAGTRHNVGFEVVSHLAGSCEWASRSPFDHVLVTIRSRPVHLTKPTTFMNDSGLAVSAILQETDIALQDIIVVVDDIHLDMGRIRIRRRGSDGGHNGLRSIIAHVGTDEFSRLRIGIGEAPPGTATDFVLTRFRPSERERMAEAYLNATDCAEDWWSLGAVEAMNRHNA